MRSRHGVYSTDWSDSNSPVLWKKVKPSLSAGRVQSVAVRLIVEREREIMNFRSTPYYRVTARFYRTDDPAKTLSRRNSTGGSIRPKRLKDSSGRAGRPTSGYSAAKANLPNATRPGRSPHPHSSRRRDAKLGMSVSQTMAVAQRLYENGYITYMRTDSQNLSSQAIAAAREEIIKMFGEEYSSARKYKTKSKGAQEAHEAIRPSYLNRQQIEGSPEEKRLYDLIWKRTVASQMSPARIETVVSIAAGESPHKFTATGEVILFDGFLRLYPKP